MADIQPLEAIRSAPDVDLSDTICPPFDIISPEEQRRLYKLSPHNAVRLELPERKGDPYQAAAKTLRQWLDKGTLVRDETPAFYVFQQEFRHGGETYRRRILFGRLRLEPWDQGTVLPHEHTFSGPKEDRLKLLSSLRLNTSPIFLVYADQQQRIVPLLASAVSARPSVEFAGEDDLACSLWRIDDPHLSVAITRGLEKEKLYIADGHHRYETALAYRDERLGGPPVARAGDEAENFVLAALAAVDDPGLLVLPIHRLVAADAPLDRTLAALSSLFEVETRPALADLLRDMDDRGRSVNKFGLIAADSPDFFLLTLTDPEAAERFLPGQRPPIWRRLDAAIATHVILRHALGLNDDQIGDIQTVWYGENADAALAEVRQGRARYAVLLNPVSTRRILAVADAGERMPQKSTFFYPKIPTGLLFNPLFGSA
ncbi:MAG: DUF1015 domain-containing protein [Dehalococcoidia bacterium]